MSVLDRIHYQINLRSIASQAPRNPFEAIAEWQNPPPAVSPLAVLRDQVATLRELGVDLLHLMPPFRMGEEARKGIGSPYAIQDPYAIDPEFGTLEEWFAFVRQAHRAGFLVILGYVPNHTARDHVWIHQHPAYFVRDASGQATYDFDWSDTAKLDYTQPGLRQAVQDVLTYWVRGACPESGVDGFRMDMAHMLNDLSFWNQAIPACRAAAGERPLFFLAECYGRSRNLDLFARGFDGAYDDDLYKIAQYGFARDAQGNSLLHLDEEGAAANGDFTPWLDAWRRQGIAGAIHSLVQAYQNDPSPRILARYTDNHDEGRGLHRFGPQATRAFQDLIAWLPHTLPFHLAGEESGAHNRPPIHEHFALCDKGFRRVHADGTRDVPGVEFTGNLYFRLSEERRNCMSDYRNRNELRHRHAALRHGDYQPLAGLPPEVLGFDRHFQGSTLRALVNLCHLPKVLPSELSLAGEVLWGQGRSHNLQAWETRLLQTKGPHA